MGDVVKVLTIVPRQINVYAILICIIVMILIVIFIILFRELR